MNVTLVSLNSLNQNIGEYLDEYYSKKFFPSVQQYDLVINVAVVHLSIYVYFLLEISYHYFNPIVLIFLFIINF